MDGQRKGEEVKEWIDRQTERERDTDRLKKKCNHDVSAVVE